MTPDKFDWLSWRQTSKPLQQSCLCSAFRQLVAFTVHVTYRHDTFSCHTGARSRYAVQLLAHDRRSVSRAHNCHFLQAVWLINIHSNIRF